MKRIVLSLCLVVAFTVLANLSQNVVAEKNAPAPTMKPVEDDVHEFMEYAFEPFFHDLKDLMASEPADKRAWKPVKAASLILAENGNLLMLRGPEEGRAKWNQIAADLRDSGQLLYQSAKKRDYATARKHYEKFVDNCNACHHAFADGEHIQKP